MNERERRFYERFHIHFDENNVFWNNEIKANLFVSVILNVLMLVLVLSWILTYLGVFDVPVSHMSYVLALNLPLMMLGSYLCTKLKGDRHWLKYLLCAICMCTAVTMAAVLNIFVTLILVVPVLVSVRYYSARLTKVISLVSTFGMAVAELLYAQFGMLNLNLVKAPGVQSLEMVGGGLREAVINAGYDKGQYVLNLFRGSFAPRLLLFVIIALICIELANRAHENVEEQQVISRRTESIRTELELATAIQHSVLPEKLSPLTEHLDMHAVMVPAKEVGGDFYDFFMIDDDHLGIVIADVSGKGIPAALFMMVSKALIKTGLCSGHSPKEVAETVNNQLLEGNDAEMFLTAWIAVLELSTGHLVSVDAGHEYPVICRADGAFELYKDKKSFIIGGMKDALYRQSDCELRKGDVLFLYTDGVPEATRADNGMFGKDRMIDVLNGETGKDPEEILKHLQESVKGFVDGNTQSDDLTMLCLRYNGNE